MPTLKKILGIFFVATLLLFPTGKTFAGGSSMSIAVAGSNSVVESGETLVGTLKIHLETYFLPQWQINHLRIDDITVACLGADIVSSANVSSDASLLETSNFNAENDHYAAHFHNINIDNNVQKDFQINLTMKNIAAHSEIAECGIKNVTITDLDHNKVIFTGMSTQDFTIVDRSEPSTLIYFGKSSSPSKT